MELLIVNGNTDPQVTEKLVAQGVRVANSGTRVTGITAPFGSSRVLSQEDNALAVDAVLEALERHCGEYDAAVIAIATDAGLPVARELVPIPVVGITESALLLGCALGGEIGVIAFGNSVNSMLRNLIQSYGLADRVASVVSVEMNRANWQDPCTLKSKTIDAVRRLVRTKSVRAIVVTGAVTGEIVESVAEAFDIPVIGGVSPAIWLAEIIVRTGNGGSRNAAWLPLITQRAPRGRDT